MRAAVTGASGHLGAALVRRLLDEGARVRAVVRDDTRALAGLDVETVRGDLSDPEGLARAFAGSECVFHFAGRISIAGDPDGSVARTNVLGTRNVVGASVAARVSRIVHVSSIHALADPGRGGTIDESASPAVGEEFPAYDRSKAAAEREIQAGISRGLPGVILNPAASIGPYDFKPSRMGRVLLDLARGRTPALVEGGFAWVDTRDVAAAAVAAARSGLPGERYLLAGRWRSVRDVASIVASRTGRRAPRIVVPLRVAALAVPVATAAARALGREPLFTRESLRALDGHRTVSCAKAAAELGFAPRPLEETIADTLEWFHERRLL
jgi:dihydroflavonol-4-reductase